MENSASAEIVVVGREGMVGIVLFMDGESSVSRAVAKIAGHAYRMAAAALIAKFSSSGCFSQRVLMFALTLIDPMMQRAACNRHHTIDQQLCLWMLMSLDRHPSC